MRQTQGYAFDAMGNRTQRVDSVAGTTAYAFDNANRLTTAGGNAYTNDADGNTLTGGGRVNTWDAQNRLVSSLMNGTSSAFTYGADGLRRSSTVTPSGGSATTTRYAYDGQTMVRSLRQNAQGAWQAAATYLTGPRGMEYRRDDLAGTVRWYVYDGLGSVVGELDPAGNLTAGKKYDVYGAERTGGTGTATTRQGFCGSLGHVADTETGLIYMRARYYDPALGRFVSEDPGYQGLNWYIYADANPVNKMDKNGRDATLWGAIFTLLELGTRYHWIRNEQLEHFLNFIAGSKEAQELLETSLELFKKLDMLNEETDALAIVDPRERLEKGDQAYALLGIGAIVAAATIYEIACMMQMMPESDSSGESPEAKE